MSYYEIDLSLQSAAPKQTNRSKVDKHKKVNSHMTIAHASS